MTGHLTSAVVENQRVEIAEGAGTVVKLWPKYKPTSALVRIDATGQTFLAKLKDVEPVRRRRVTS
ncbi:MAG: hypothetical protein KGL39_34370 [Patescibacteria group bacterium]|nr:hypothetical protein [Patescibacteria group bacterium]